MLDFIKENPILSIIIFLLIVSPSFLFGAVQVIAVIVFVLILLGIIALASLRWKVRKIQKEAQGAYGAEQRAEASDMNTHGSATKKRVADDVGDYVEFEEIKEK